MTLQRYLLILVASSMNLWGSLLGMDVERPQRQARKSHRLEINARLEEKEVKHIADSVVFATRDKELFAKIGGTGTPELPELVSVFKEVSSVRYCGEKAENLIFDLRDLLHTLVKDAQIYEELKKNTALLGSLTKALHSALETIVQTGYAGKKKHLECKAAEGLCERLTFLFHNSLSFLTNYSKGLVDTVTSLYADAISAAQLHVQADDALNKARDAKKNLGASPTKKGRHGDLMRAKHLTAMNAADETIKRCEEEYKQTKTAFERACTILANGLYSFGSKTVFLLNNRACKQRNDLGRLSPQLVMNIFDLLEQNNDHKILVTSAAAKFVAKPEIHDGFVLTLQHYLCAKEGGKGYIWEISVASFLYDTLEYNPVHVFKTMNTHISKRSSDFSREFDATTTKLLVECKSCMWDRVPDEVLRGTRQQFWDQKDIAGDNSLNFVVISKNRLTEELKRFLEEKKIAYIDPLNAGSCALLKNVLRLYEKPYFVKD